MESATTSLVTLAQARLFLGWDEGAHADMDERLVSLIDSVSEAVKAGVECDLKPIKDIVEKIDGTGKSYLFLAHWPVTKLTSVVEDGVTLIEDTDFYVDYDRGFLQKPTDYKWTTSMRGVVVTYDAGCAALPADIKMACLIEIARLYSMVDNKMFGESSRTHEGETININTDELLPATIETLGRYQRVRL